MVDAKGAKLVMLVKVDGRFSPWHEQKGSFSRQDGWGASAPKPGTARLHVTHILRKHQVLRCSAPWPQQLWQRQEQFPVSPKGMASKEVFLTLAHPLDLCTTLSIPVSVCFGFLSSLSPSGCPLLLPALTGLGSKLSTFSLVGYSQGFVLLALHFRDRSMFVSDGRWPSLRKGRSALAKSLRHCWHSGGTFLSLCYNFLMFK